jgi:DNA-directed RNA polymerase subunit M/transcription elongation factor TFIIS
MYYVRLKGLKENNNLIYYCRKCGNEDTNISQDNVIISNTNLKKQEQNFEHIVNEYTKLDPTLPRINNIDCVNKECISNTDDNMEPEIIFMRYDNINMKYLYLCTYCDKVWDFNEKN